MACLPQAAALTLASAAGYYGHKAVAAAQLFVASRFCGSSPRLPLILKPGKEGGGMLLML